MNGYSSKRSDFGMDTFHSTHRMMTTVIQARNRPVPMKRAIRYDSRRKGPGPHAGRRRRRGGRGWASRGARGRRAAVAPTGTRARVPSRSGASGRHLLAEVELVLPPVVREHVVEHV